MAWTIHKLDLEKFGLSKPLQPCPFCKGTEIEWMITYETEGKTAFIHGRCMECYAEISNMVYYRFHSIATLKRQRRFRSHLQSLVKDWNSRYDRFWVILDDLDPPVRMKSCPFCSVERDPLFHEVNLDLIEMERDATYYEPSVFERFGNPDVLYVVVCSSCGLSGPPKRTKDKAVEAWNEG